MFRVISKRFETRNLETLKLGFWRHSRMSTLWKSRYAQRTLGVKSSAIRELLKVTQKPEIISFGGGLPAPDVFPVKRFEEACHKVLTEHGAQALQYGATEGYQPLREMIAQQPGPLRHRRQRRERPHHFRIATGSRSDRQVAHQPRRPRPGRSPHLPWRAAGIQRLRRAIRFRPGRR